MALLRRLGVPRRTGVVGRSPLLDGRGVRLLFGVVAVGAVDALWIDRGVVLRTPDFNKEAFEVDTCVDFAEGRSCGG